MLREHNGVLDYAALDDMKFLHCCVKEALRMNPPLILVMRKVLKSFDVKGFHIPEVGLHRIHSHTCIAGLSLTHTLSLSG